MDVKDILRKAVEAVEAAEVPEPLREAAFTKAVDLVAGAQPVRDATAMGASSIAVGALSDPRASDTPLGKIASRLKVSEDIVREVFHEQDGILDIIVSPAKLPSQKSRATKELALLIAAGRQASGFDDFTSVDTIRPVVENFKKYDGPNYSTTISEMTVEFNQRGTGRKKEVRVSKPGWETATTLVRRLGGAED